MSQLPEEVLYDMRLVERHLRQGLITRAEYEKYLAQRPDVESEGEVLDLETIASGSAKASSTHDRSRSGN